METSALSSMKPQQASSAMASGPVVPKESPAQPPKTEWTFSSLGSLKSFQSLKPSTVFDFESVPGIDRATAKEAMDSLTDVWLDRDDPLYQDLCSRIIKILEKDLQPNNIKAVALLFDYILMIRDINKGMRLEKHLEYINKLENDNSIIKIYVDVVIQALIKRVESSLQDCDLVSKLIFKNPEIGRKFPLLAAKANILERALRMESQLASYSSFPLAEPSSAVGSGLESMDELYAED